MHSSEPVRKKVKLVPDVDLLQGTGKSLVAPADVTLRGPSNASDSCELAESTTSATAVVESQSFRVFVLDIESRLFVTGQLLLKVALLCNLLPTYLWCILVCTTYASIQIMTRGKNKALDHCNDQP